MTEATKSYSKNVKVFWEFLKKQYEFSLLLLKPTLHLRALYLC